MSELPCNKVWYLFNVPFVSVCYFQFARLNRSENSSLLYYLKKK